MKCYGERYFQDEERRHDTTVNRTNGLVDYAEKVSEALLGVQEDVKRYGERYFQDKVEEQRHDIILNPIKGYRRRHYVQYLSER